MSQDSAKFEAAVPILTVDSLTDALEYYERVLGFQTGWVHGDPPRVASVCRDNVEINLRQREPDVRVNMSTVYFQLNDVDSIFKHVQSCGGNIKEPVSDRSYGMRDFSLHDPSGNELGFGQPS